MAQIQDSTPLKVDTNETIQITPITDDPEPEIQSGVQEAHGEQHAVDFGASDAYGQRLNYQKKKCRNPICFILYYLQTFTLIGFTIYLLAYLIPEYLEERSNPTPNTNNLVHSIPHHMNLNDFNDMNLAAATNPPQDEFDFTGIAVSLLTAAGSALVLSFIWLQVLNCCAGPIIQLMLILNILVWVALLVVGCVYVLPWLIIFSAIFVLIFSLWSWCVWDKIRFAVVLLGVASEIISSYNGVIWLSIAVMAFNLGYIILWSACTYAYFWYIVELNIKFQFWIAILLLISLFWGNAVNRNISHTTTCGVTATWYFSSGVNFMPTCPAFWRSMTTSFGSIALGSFFVGLLEAVRSMFRNCMGSKYTCVRCWVRCWLQCINWLIIYFNKYAYAHCAIYGSGFIHAAQQTWNLFMNKGLMALVNDDLTGAAITCGALVVGVACGGIGWAVGHAFYGDFIDEEWQKYGLLTCIAVFCGLVGWAMAEICLHPLPSAVQCLFVCWAEEPEVLAENNPKVFKALTDACRPVEKTEPQANYPAGKR
eukprot:940519_1